MILLTILWAGLFINIDLRGQGYVDDNAVYVDAPVGNNQDIQNGAEQIRNPSVSYFEQLSTGLFNYGYVDSIYYQFSGNSIFEGGNSPTAMFSSITWTHIIPLEYEHVPGIALSADFINFSSDSDSVYGGDEGDTVDGPSIDMLLFMSSFMVKVFFMDPIEEFLQPYFAVGWGVIFGSFESTKVNGDKSSTSFTGRTSHRNLGAHIKLSDRAGMIMEFRIQTARATTSNDPFNQSSGSSVDLIFDGIMIGLSGYYRF